eukprot:SAG25_NODE_37_length_19691_cov_19.319467_7_plen_85_part_00
MIYSGSIYYVTVSDADHSFVNGRGGHSEWASEWSPMQTACLFRLCGGDWASEWSAMQTVLLLDRRVGMLGFAVAHMLGGNPLAV